MIKRFDHCKKVERATRDDISEIVSASVPERYRDLLISRLNQDLLTVLRWSNIGHQFNLGQWVKDTNWQVALLSEEKVPPVRHVRNIYYSCKNALFVILIIPLLILQGKMHDIFTKKTLSK